MRNLKNKLIVSGISALSMLCVLPSAVQAREVHNFNAAWQFKKGPFSVDPVKLSQQWDAKWDSVTVPHTWNATDMQLKVNAFYEGTGYYKKSFFVDKSLEGKRLFLRFEGVGANTEVFVNGKQVGTHKGGYSAFSFEIGTALKYGSDNEILVKADNTARPDVIPVNHSLFGVYGGIYRPVWLVVTDKSNICVTDHASSGVYITQKNVSKSGADITIKAKLDNAGLMPENLIVENTVYTQDGKKVTSDKQPFTLTPQGIKSVESKIRIRNPRLWQGRKDPHLYKVVTQLKKGNEIIDEVIQPLGVRKYEAIAGKGFFLNGEKYPMYGVTRHQDWWELGSALENKHHDHDLNEIMDIGATTVRFAHYQQSDYLYSKCDSLGLIIWAEIPFVNRVTGQEWENAHSQLREMIRQSFNHPSIYVWGLHNEVYHPHEYTAALTQSLHDLAKTEDPDRYTVAVNGYGHVEHAVNQNADIQGMNRYFGWYEKKVQDIEPWIEKMETQYPWQKFMLTEYGADANLDHQTEYLGDALNWGKPFYPETFQTKTHEYQWSVIAKHPYILASYLWNMFDFAVPMWNRGGVPARNLKGLISFDRKIKKDSYYWYKANWSDDPVLYLTQRRNTDREKKITNITVYSNKGVPLVSLNGKLLPSPKKGYTDVHYVFENVELAQGENRVQASIRDGQSELSDEIVWNYTGEKKREADSYSNKNTHAGW